MEAVYKCGLDPRYSLEDGTYQVSLIVTFPSYDGKKKTYQVKYYGLGYYLTKNMAAENFKKLKASKDDEHRKILVEMAKAIAKADDIFTRLGRYTPATIFKREFLEEAGDNSILDVCQRIYTKNWNAQKYRTAYRYQGFATLLTRYAKRPHVPFGEIDENWLEDFAAWMKADEKDADGNIIRDGWAVATVATRLKALKAIFNYARKKLKLIPKSMDPFDNFPIQEGADNKQALEVGQVKALFKYQPKSRHELEAIDIWKMSYYGSGLNPIDLFTLKFKEVYFEEGAIYKIRRKTKGSLKKVEPMGLPLERALGEILARRMQKSQALNPEAYVLGYLAPDATELDIFKFRTSKGVTMNKILKRIGYQLGFKFDLTMSTARHTFATHLKNRSADLRDIQELMGHATEAQTETYFKNTITPGKRKAVRMLVQ